MSDDNSFATFAKDADLIIFSAVCYEEEKVMAKKLSHSTLAFLELHSIMLKQSHLVFSTYDFRRVIGRRFLDRLSG